MTKVKHITRIAYKQQPEKGERGALPRVSEWVADFRYLAGNVGEAFADYVYYNGVYYRCMQTHTSISSQTPYALVNAASNLWAVETDYKFLATKVVYVGSGTEGWIIDEGRIYHSSGLIELNANGTIHTSNGKFSLDKNGNIMASSGTFAGFLKIPFIPISVGCTNIGQGQWRVSDKFNLRVDSNAASGIGVELQLPAAASFSGVLLTIYDCPMKTKNSPTLTITCQSGAKILHPSCKGELGLQEKTQIICPRGGLLQLLAVNESGNYCYWMVVSDVMPDAEIS